MTTRKFFQALALTGFVFGFAGWVYIAAVALVHPHTLGLQLTHFSKYPHEDTFGETCFVISLISFFIYQLIKDDRKPSGK
jgi:hypothetical protein